MVTFIDAEQFKEAMGNDRRVLVATLSPGSEPSRIHVFVHIDGPEEYKELDIQPGNVKREYLEGRLIQIAEENGVGLIHPVSR